MAHRSGRYIPRAPPRAGSSAEIRPGRMSSGPSGGGGVNFCRLQDEPAPSQEKSLYGLGALYMYEPKVVRREWPLRHRVEVI